MLSTQSSEDYYNRLIAAIFNLAVDIFSRRPPKHPIARSYWNNGTSTNRPMTQAFTQKFTTKLKVVLAIDEASTLLELPPNEEEAARLQKFCRSLRNVPICTGIFAVLVDTDSRITIDFSPNSRYDPSSREIGTRGGQGLRVYLSDALMLKKAATPAIAVDQMALYALRKLLSYDKITETLKITEARALALLGPTIGVSLHAEDRLNVQLTASHAAHCGYLDPTNNVQHSPYPSQPIHALAANNYLYKNEGGRQIRQQNNSTFLETLTGLLANELGLGSIDDIRKKRLLDERMMFWNHFMHCTLTPTTRSLMEGLHRGLATQYLRNQFSFDQVLTIYLKDQSRDSLDEKDITFCGVQVKNAKDNASAEELQSWMTPEHAGIDISDANPNLALLFDLKYSPESPDQPVKETRAAENLTSTYKLAPVHDGDPDLRQGFLVFHGLDAGIVPVDRADNHQQPPRTTQNASQGRRGPLEGRSSSAVNEEKASMYWPTGSASRLAHSSTQTPGRSASTHHHHHHPDAGPSTSQQHAHRRGQELLGIGSCAATPHAPIGLFATWTATELTIWTPKPKIAISKLIRSHDSLSRLGHIRDVQWKPDHNEHILIIWTAKSALIIYKLEPLPSTASVYTLPPEQSSSFLATGPADRIPFPRLALKLVGEIDRADPAEEMSCLALTPSHILIGLQSPVPQLRAISWASIRAFFLAFDPPDPDRHLRHHRHHSHHQDHLFHSNPAVQFSLKNPLADFDWFIDKSVTLLSLTYCSELNLYVFVTSDGRAYVGHLLYAQPARRRATRMVEDEAVRWVGRCVHEPVARLGHLPATGACAVNVRFSLVAIGVQKGMVDVYSLRGPALLADYSHSLNLQASQADDYEPRAACEPGDGVVKMCAWTSDGHALAVAGSHGFSVWSVYGRLQTSGRSAAPSETHGPPEHILEDYFMASCQSLFWGPGNFELFLLAAPALSSTRDIADDQLFVLPFAHSAVATLHSPDNTKHGFLQLDDRVSVYRGTESADLAMLNRESDVWQHIKIPADYISTNWPIESSCISDDAKLLAVAGRHGFTHFNAVSGRWKLFENEDDEQAIRVQGGMQWFRNILVTAIEEAGSYSIRLFARENTLSLSNCLFEYPVPHLIILLAIYDTSLLIYTADNTLSHFIIKDQTLIHCGSIGFEGVVGNPMRARGLSWLIPDAQHCFGEPEKDLDHALIILLVGGNVVLLRPQRSGRAEVKYDMQILAERVEFYWAGRQLIHGQLALLENSLWAWDGKQICVWLDALAIDNVYSPPHPEKELQLRQNRLPTESRLTIPLNFHPLSVLMDKGIFVGIEQETVVKKSFNFALFRIVTNTELFIHQLIKFYLSRGKMEEAVEFGAHYSELIYFGHSLEILLYTVLDEEEDFKTDPGGHLQKLTSSSSVDSDATPTLTTTAHADANGQSSKQERLVLLPLVAEFLDHFKESLKVVVGCARKIDIKQWTTLFRIVGKPRDLFEKSLDLGLFQVASSYLLILNHYYLDDEAFFNSPSRNLSRIQPHNQIHEQAKTHHSHPDEDHYSIEIILSDTVRLFKVGMQVKNWTLCKELMRFLFSLDHTGTILTKALQEAGLALDWPVPTATADDPSLQSAPNPC
ncbi:hypothetical protein PCANC_15687 [Puccinia coronata f. sp. avenae]|uniref:RIC1 C-terminal alpha solenoid region domain-containing protein n=1 Tax=Puccinia coronata f. sp. avenae TaxID=200324 RepID=A0A2N5SQI6_9BASI|nr:hypothetical protein PCANC_15687 [Puccinia coronata f. sp. avenae]